MGTVVKELIVNAPISQVFAFWKNFENFPRFMKNIESIQVTGPDLTHWKCKGPLGTDVEWDAKTTYVEENKKIAWQSTGGTIETHGAVSFHAIGATQTKDTVGNDNTQPAGAREPPSRRTGLCPSTRSVPARPKSPSASNTHRPPGPWEMPSPNSSP